MKARILRKIFWLADLPVGSIIELPHEMVNKMVTTGQVERLVSKDKNGKFAKKVKDETPAPDKGKI